MAGVEEYIIDNAFNKDNLTTLIKSFNREVFIPFIGAGPSTILGEPGWEELITNLYKAFGLKIRRAKLPNGKVDYPKIFSNLCKKIGDKEQFYKKLFEHLRPTQTEITGFHLKLVDLFHAYVTTNYDSPIEIAFKNQHKTELRKYFFSCYGTNNLKDCVVYLHGHKEINFCIIKTEDYDYFYPSVNKKNGIPILEDFLSEIFTEKNIIFCGFSFDDFYLENFISYLHAMKPIENCHYWLLSESVEAFREIMKKADEYNRAGKSDEATAVVSSFFHGKMNIKPIVYKQGEHIFIEKLFEILIKSLPTTIASGKVSALPVR